jgi:D-alanine-D-alanine ligase
MKINVLMGGISPERNISFLSGRATVTALRANGHDVRAIDPARGAHGLLSDDEIQSASPKPVTDEELAAFDPRALVDCIESALFDDVDVVFLVLHGKYGEDGYIQSLLDLRGLKYTGSSMLASAVAMDKITSKMLFSVAGIPTPHWVTLQHDQADDEDVIAEVRREIPGSIVVKPNDQGSTVGMTIVHAGDDLSAAVRLAGHYSKSVLIEQYIPGRELTVTVLGNDALPIIEIAPKEGFYDYENKYTKGRTEYHCPAELSEEVQHHVQNLAVAAHGVLGCHGYSRVDFRLTEDNLPFCLEVNTIPGFTETSLVPMSARQAGLEFGDLCEELIRSALSR